MLIIYYQTRFIPSLTYACLAWHRNISEESKAKPELHQRMRLIGQIVSCSTFRKHITSFRNCYIRQTEHRTKLLILQCEVLESNKVLLDAARFILRRERLDEETLQQDPEASLDRSQTVCHVILLLSIQRGCPFSGYQGTAYNFCLEKKNILHAAPKHWTFSPILDKWVRCSPEGSRVDWLFSVIFWYSYLLCTHVGYI